MKHGDSVLRLIAGKGRHTLRKALAFVLAYTMLLSLVPAAALAEMGEEVSDGGVATVWEARLDAESDGDDAVDAEETSADENMLDGENLPSGEDAPGDEKPVERGDATSDQQSTQQGNAPGDERSIGQEDIPSEVTETLDEGTDAEKGGDTADQKSGHDKRTDAPVKKDESAMLVEESSQEIRDAVSMRADLAEADEQAKFVVTLFDACVANLTWSEDTLALVGVDNAGGLYRELVDASEDAEVPTFGALRELLDKDITEAGIAAVFAQVLGALDVECIEVEGANGAHWVMACVGEAWYHVDPVAAAKAVAACGDADARDAAHAWLLVSDETVYSLDTSREPWGVGDGDIEIPVTGEGFTWESDSSFPIEENNSEVTEEQEPETEVQSTIEDGPEQGAESLATVDARPKDEEQIESSTQEAEGSVAPKADGEMCAGQRANVSLFERLQARNGIALPQARTQAIGGGPELQVQAICDGTRQAFLEVVDEQDVRSYRGDYDNDVMYNGWNGEPWCGHFIAWCAREAGVSYDCIPSADTAKSVPRLANWFGSDYHSCWSDYEPKAGDIAFLDNNGHVGVVVGRSGPDVVVKEGNVGKGGSNDEVQVNTYWKSGGRICGYGETFMPERYIPPEQVIPDWSKYGGDAWLPSGYYSIRPVLDTNKYLEVGGGGRDNGTNVQIWEYPWPGEREHMKFHLNRLEDGSYGIDTFAGKVLDVWGASKENGANVYQWDWVGGSNQKWYIHDCGNGVYAFEAQHSGKYLDLKDFGTSNGNNVQQCEYNGSDAQKWVVTPCDPYGWKMDPPDGWWYVRSVLNQNFSWDINDISTENGANLQLWDWDRVVQRQFRFIDNGDGSCRIEARCSGKVMDVEGESRALGANIQQVYWKDIDCQKWYLEDAGEGRVAIRSKQSGLYMDVQGGNAQTGQNIWQWNRNEGDGARLWYLTPAAEGNMTTIPSGTYELVAAKDGSSVVTATDFNEDYDFAALANSTGELRQRFTLTTSSDGSVRMRNIGNDLYMDVYAASVVKGAYNNFVEDTGTPQQHWYVEDAGSGTFSFRNKWTNLYLDLKSGGTDEGTRLQMWEGNSTDAQKFKLRRLTLNDATIDAIASQAYTGSAVTPNPTVRFASRVLEEGRDYTVSYTSNVAAGTATVKVTGANGFEGSKSATFSIVKASLSSATLSAISDQPYTGSAAKPELTVTLGGKRLVKGTDYTLSWSNNVNVGTATVTVTGVGSYTGSKSTTFRIVAATAVPTVFVSPEGFTYDGSQKNPTVTVTAGGKILTKGTDYDLSYTGDFTNVGTHTVKATLKGNYSGTAQASVQISAADVSGAIIASIANKTFTGSQIKPAPIVRLGDKTLAKDTDYTLSWSNNINAGTATVEVTGKGNYTGSLSTTFKIVAKAITPSVVFSNTTFTYSGSVQRPTVTVKDGETTLAESQYSVLWPSGCTNVGTYSVTVTLKDNYSGSAAKDFSIAAVDLSSATVSAIAEQAYTGSAIEPSPSILLDGKNLVRDTDYTLSWSGNTNAGTATVTATGKNNYTGEKSATFSIARAKIAVPTANVCTYNGKAQVGVTEGVGYGVTGTFKAVSAGTYSATVTPDGNHMWLDGGTGAKSIGWTIARRQASVRANNVARVVGETDPQLTARVLGTVGSETVSYRLDRERGESVGSYEIVATGDAIQGDYEVSFYGATFTIAQGLLDDATIGGLPAEVEYDGAEKRPSPVVRLGGRQLIAGTDYVVSYYDNIEPGTASIVVAGIGDFSGEADASFRIVPRKTLPKVTLSNGSFVYNGEAQRPNVSVKDGQTEVPSSQYEITWPDGCVDVGTYDIEIKFKGLYSGTATEEFTIQQADVSTALVSTVPDETYIGSAFMPEPTVYVSGRLLVKDIDYTLSWSNNVNAGTATVAIRGKGNYGGTKRVAFKINKAASKVSLAAQTKTYNGKTQAYSGKVTKSGSVGKVTYSYFSDAACAMPVAAASVKDAGSYYVRATLAADANHTAATSAVAKLSISKAASKISLAAQTKAYNGKAQAYSGKVTRSGSTGKVTYSYYKDAKCTKAVKAADVKNAGTYYVKAKLAADANHNGATSAVAKLTISRAKVAVPKATNRPYTGKAQVGVPAGTGYKLVGTAKATKAGTYTATATPDANHRWSDGKTNARKLTWKVVAPSVTYQTHVQGIGDQGWMSDGRPSGTFGQSKRLEGIWIRLPKKPVSGSIRYRTHVQGIGDQEWRGEGEMSGTHGQSKRLEAIQIELTGNMARTYDVYYRVHAQRFGWMGWAKNGGRAGTAGYSYRLEAIQIVLVPKGGKAPAANYGGYQQATGEPFARR